MMQNSGILFLMLFVNNIFLLQLAQACPEGYDSFQASVFPKVRKDCARCHDGQNAQAPAFATADAKASYESLLNYMNFSEIKHSLFVIRAGNGHCALKNCDEKSGSEMEVLATKWWNQGENLCFRNGKYFTQEVAIPKQLPTVEEGYVTMAFPLDQANPELSGMSIVFNIQNFQDESDDTKGAYRINSPRLVNGHGSILLRDIKVLLNGKYDEIYNEFTAVSQISSFIPLKQLAVQSATPVLSGQNLILLKDGLENPMLSVSFMEIQRGSGAVCVHPEKFQSIVLPQFNQLNCVSCHSGKANQIGMQVFNLQSSESQICQTATELASAKYMMTSTLVTYPTAGHSNHVAIPDEMKEKYSDAIKSWLAN